MNVQARPAREPRRSRHAVARQQQLVEDETEAERSVWRAACEKPRLPPMRRRLDLVDRRAAVDDGRAEAARPPSTCRGHWQSAAVQGCP